MRIIRIASAKIDIDWNSVDWSKNTREIARSLNVSEGTVWNYRRLYAPDTIKKLNFDWGDVDWSKTNQEISLEFGIADVSGARRLHAPQTVDHGFDYSQINWSKSNRQISQETGLSPFTIAGKRRLLAPKTIKSIFPSGIDWTSVDWSQRSVDLAEELGVSSSVVSYQRGLNAPETLQPPTTPPIWDWASVDWGKTNEEIAQEIGATLYPHDKPNRNYWMGVLQRRVGITRRRYSPDNLGMQGGVGNEKINWEPVDWTKTDEQIANEERTSARNVRQMRLYWRRKLSPT